jgi:carbon-monoxide dehydrogenase large subunit
MASRLTGQSIERVEDDRFLRGGGRFIGALDRPGLLHLAFVRSPVAHATIRSIDVSPALEVPGVVAAFTGEQVKAAMATPLALVAPPSVAVSPYFPLAIGKVRLVGDPVAVVVAESPVAAADGAAAVVADFDALPAVVSIDAAVADGATLLWEELGSNVLTKDTSSYGPVDELFASAAHVVTRRYEQHRFCHAPLEPRAGLAEWSPVTGKFLYEASHKRPHPMKMTLAGVLGLPFQDVRVVARDIGGGFGSKGQITREDIALCVVAKLLARPVKWVETRTENLQTAGHAREEDLEIDAAVEADGRLRALRVRMRLDAGAYPMAPFPPTMFTTLVKMLLPNAYRIEGYQFDATVAYTNKASYISYRGPWAAETYVRERLLDDIARELGLTPEDVRRVNLLRPEDQPTELITGPRVVGVTARETMEQAIALLDLPVLRARQAEARETGRLLGIGFATFMENAPGPADFAGKVGFDLPSETAWARLEPTGDLTIHTWQVSHGQSHETTLAQVCADELGLPITKVRIMYGDSDNSPFNTISTGGSRSAMMAHGATRGATRVVRDQVLRIASKLLEADVADLETVDSAVQVRGVPARAIPIADIARMAWFAPSSLPDGMQQGLMATFDFKVPTDGGWTSATHACVVEVHPDTGAIDIERYLVVEDCGQMINPEVVEGQIRGGVAQGLAGVLYERLVYGDDGQLVTSSFADYLVPAASDLPDVEVHHLHREPMHETDYRGVGEGGMIGAPAALTNAVADALAQIGVALTEQYLSPERVRQLVASGRAVSGA